MKIWNLTDDPRLDVPAHTRMVLGQKVDPGKYANVSDNALEGATKLQKEIDSGMLFVGEKPPQEYLAALDRARVKFRGKRTHQHGMTPRTKTVTVKDSIPVEDRPSVKIVERSFRKRSGK